MPLVKRGGVSYTLPTASDEVLGGVKVGANLSIADGVLSAEAGGVSSWDDLTDKPESFAPSAHALDAHTGVTLAELNAKISDATIPSDAAATTSAAGVVELATSAEAIAGTDTDRAITPSVSGSRLTFATTSTDDATSATSAPLKSAGGLAVAKDAWVGGKKMQHTSYKSTVVLYLGNILGVVGKGIEIDFGTLSQFSATLRFSGGNFSNGFWTAGEWVLGLFHTIPSGGLFSERYRLGNTNLLNSYLVEMIGSRYLRIYSADKAIRPNHNVIVELDFLGPTAIEAANSALNYTEYTHTEG